MAEAKAEQRVRRAGVHNGCGEFFPVEKNAAAAQGEMGKRVAGKRYLNVRMVEHSLKESGVAVRRHGLNAVAEIAVVVSEHNRHAVDNGCVNLRNRLLPLFGRIVDKDAIEHVVAEGADLTVAA